MSLVGGALGGAGSPGLLTSCWGGAAALELLPRPLDLPRGLPKGWDILNDVVGLFWHAKTETRYIRTAEVSLLFKLEHELKICS